MSLVLVKWSNTCVDQSFLKWYLTLGSILLLLFTNIALAGAVTIFVMAYWE